MLLGDELCSPLPAELPSPKYVCSFRKISTQTENLAASLDPRLKRSLSRASLLLIDCIEKIISKNPDLKDIDPTRVGIFAALDAGPLPQAAVHACVDASIDSYHEKLRQQWPPKQTLKFSSAVAAGALSIYSGWRGTCYVFNCDQHAIHHALQQALLEIEQGTIDYACVCSAFSFEDPLLILREIELSDEKKDLYVESAALLFCSAEILKEIGEKFEMRSATCQYGIASTMVNVLQGMCGPK